MKKILIVADSLSMGGLEKTLIDLCNNFDYTKYKVDLYLFNEGRELLEKLNKNVTLLPKSPYYSLVFNKSVGKSVATLLKKGQFWLASYRIWRFIKVRLKKRSFTRTDWHFQKKTMLKISEKYDVAIGYAEGTSCYYVAECVDAPIKNMWIHTDISAIESNRELDEMAFSKAKHICTVSQNSKRALEEIYPKFKEKIKVFTLPSLMDFSKVEYLVEETNEMDKSGCLIVSVGRLVELKGFHLCPVVLRRLIDEGYKVKWYVCGEGPQRDELESLIKKYGLENEFILLGNKSNPYTYIKGADICVQPSSYEGFSLVLYEEKYLKKPIVATNIACNAEVVTDGENGLLVERDSESIYTALKRLLDNKEEMEHFGETPANNFVTKEETVKKIEETFQE